MLIIGYLENCLGCKHPSYNLICWEIVKDPKLLIIWRWSMVRIQGIIWTSFTSYTAKTASFEVAGKVHSNDSIIYNIFPLTYLEQELPSKIILSKIVFIRGCQVDWRNKEQHGLGEQCCSKQQELGTTNCKIGELPKTQKQHQQINRE